MILGALLYAAAAAQPAIPPPSPARVTWLLSSLAGFGTRHTLSTTTQTCRGIGAARRFLASEMAEIARRSGGRLRAEEDAWVETDGGERVIGPPPTLVNVLGIIDGADPVLKKRILIVSGHYDSRNTDILDAASDAPGVDDDGSGTAVVVEAARMAALALRGDPPARTLVFAALPGEEQGLLGGRRLLAWCRARGYAVEGVLNHDIVGSPTGPDGTRREHEIRLFSTDRGGADNPCRTLGRRIAETARMKALPVRPVLVYRRDRRGRGGDQIPFEEAGLAAIRFTEPVENYDHQHQDVRWVNGRFFGDTLDFVDAAYVANVARLAAEAVLELSLAPAQPGDVRLSGAVVHDTVLSWKAGPGTPAGTTFEVLVRRTAASDWEEVRDAGSAERVTYPFEAADDRIYAVRAVGPGGARGIPVVVGENVPR